MNSSRSRALRLLAPLALAAVAVWSGATKEASAQTTCPLHLIKVTYYSEPEKINAVGTCTSYCSYTTPSNCTGTQTQYSTVNYRIACPFCIGSPYPTFGN
ncbi:MAG TPA: hypothetical protein VEL74_03875 [Thermoanaerobaculia bacterium]|nr:hypothetical protein [Thermoanaerobaculia bacterium]